MAIPEALARGPFTLGEAREAGLEYWHLRSRRWRRLGPTTCTSAKNTDGPILQLEAAMCRLPAAATISGLSAAWLHGLDVEPCNPIEVTIPKGVGISARSGMKVSRAGLCPDEVKSVRGIPTTTIMRTLDDLGRRLPLVEGLVIADMALHLGLVEQLAFRAHAQARRGGRGLLNLRRVAVHSEPKAESPMETRLRMLLVLAGLPRPAAQVPIHDHGGRFLGRPDLYYSERRLGIEYDGAAHRDSLAEDNRRQNRLLQEGIRLLRFTAADVLSRKDLVVAQVRALLA